MPSVVLDASALIALVRKEPGWKNVLPLLPDAKMSAVNVCETIQRLRRGGMPLEAVQLILKSLVPEPVSFDEAQAYVAASIHQQTRDRGISFGNCACLALAMSRDLPAATAERKWDALGIKVTVKQIR